MMKKTLVAAGLAIALTVSTGLAVASAEEASTIRQPRWLNRNGIRSAT